MFVMCVCVCCTRPLCSAGFGIKIQFNCSCWEECEHLHSFALRYFDLLWIPSVWKCLSFVQHQICIEIVAILQIVTTQMSSVLTENAGDKCPMCKTRLSFPTKIYLIIILVEGQSVIAWGFAGFRALWCKKNDDSTIDMPIQLMLPRSDCNFCGFASMFDDLIRCRKNKLNRRLNGTYVSKIRIEFNTKLFFKLPFYIHRSPRIDKFLMLKQLNVHEDGKFTGTSKFKQY